MNQDLQEAIDVLLHNVQTGEEDALDVFIQLRDMEKIIGNAVEKVKSAAYAVADAKVGTDYNGVKIRMSEGRETWDFKSIPAWVKVTNGYKESIKKIEEEAKERYTQHHAGVQTYLAEELPIKKVGDAFLTLTFPK
jgi:hypothetical protein